MAEPKGKIDWEKQTVPEWWLPKEEWLKRHKPKTDAFKRWDESHKRVSK